MEEEEGIIYLKMTGTFLAWGHYSTCLLSLSLFFKDIFLFFPFPSNFKLKIFIVLSFNSQALMRLQRGKDTQCQFRNSVTFHHILELEGSNRVDKRSLRWKHLGFAGVEHEVQSENNIHTAATCPDQGVRFPSVPTPLPRCFYY